MNFREENNAPPNTTRSFNFALKEPDCQVGKPSDAQIIPVQPNNTFAFYYKPGHQMTSFRHAFVARPLNRLTLRIGHKSWTCSYGVPTDPDVFTKLALDPASEWATLLEMRHNDQRRQNGHHPRFQGQQMHLSNGQWIHSPTWGAMISALPDLQEFELVLETWKVKEDQLEEIEAAARKWIFHLDNTDSQLQWSRTIHSNWMDKDNANAEVIHPQNWDEACREIVVRNIYFKRAPKDTSIFA
jgi:hypothetical protein